jgi:hypothetical protein
MSTQQHQPAKKDAKMKHTQAKELSSGELNPGLPRVALLQVTSGNTDHYTTED